MTDTCDGEIELEEVSGYFIFEGLISVKDCIKIKFFNNSILAMDIRDPHFMIS